MASVADGTEAWRVPGIVAGAAGAITVAMVFLVLDLGAGRPMWTPSALGSLLFRGRPLPVDSGWVPALALGYTMVHGALFLGIASIAAQLLGPAEGRDARRRFSPLLLAGGLFIAFEAAFLSIAFLFDRGLIAQLGAGPVALANMAAAVVMAWTLCRSSGDSG